MANNDQANNDQATNFRAGDAVIVCGGKYATKVGHVVRLLGVKIKIKIRGDVTPRNLYPRQLRMRNTEVQNRYVFIPESVDNATHVIALGLYRADYSDEEGEGALNHVFARIRNEYNTFRNSE
jgi:hypothetical protein